MVSVSGLQKTDKGFTIDLKFSHKVRNPGELEYSHGVEVTMTVAGDGSRAAADDNSISEMWEISVSGNGTVELSFSQPNIEAGTKKGDKRYFQSLEGVTLFRPIGLTIDTENASVKPSA